MNAEATVRDRIIISVVLRLMILRWCGDWVVFFVFWLLKGFGFAVEDG